MNFTKICHIALFFLSVLVVAFAHPRRFKEDNSDPESNDSRDKRQFSHGITGPVLTFVKTDKNANYKWGVRHHAGHHYAGRR